MIENAPTPMSASYNSPQSKNLRRAASSKVEEPKWVMALVQVAQNALTLSVSRKIIAANSVLWIKIAFLAISASLSNSHRKDETTPSWFAKSPLKGLPAKVTLSVKKDGTTSAPPKMSTRSWNYAVLSMQGKPLMKPAPNMKTVAINFVPLPVIAVLHLANNSRIALSLR